jgi:hypothetical protein
MGQEDIIYKSVCSFHKLGLIKNNEDLLIEIIRKNSLFLNTSINNYIKDYYSNNNNLNYIFGDRQLKKLIKDKIVYNEMLNLIEKKNNEIANLKRKLAYYESK